ncbi:hypothetical protein H1R20_g172, partial [Candolleomyces eurysporus]
MKEAQIDRTEAANAPKAPENLALAQKHFRIRFEELMTLIKAEETKFRTVMKEIEDIKSGKWDSNLRAKISGVPEATTEKDEPENSTAPDEDTGDKQEDEEPTQDGSESVAEQAPDEDEQGDEGEEKEEASQEVDEEEETGTQADVSMADDEETKAPASNPEDEEGADNEVETLLEVHSEAGNEAQEPSRTSEQPASPKETEQAQDEGESSADEPLQTIRRSTRRKSSAASTAPPRPRTRRQRQKQEQEPADSEPETDTGVKAETPQQDEELPSSPFEGTSTRTREGMCDSPGVSTKLNGLAGKRKASFPDEATREAKRVREDSELPEEDESATPARTRSTRQGKGPSEQVPNKKFQNVIGLLHQQISAHRNGTIFHNPIKLSDAPDYHEIVKRPMDLKTIKGRVKDGAISNSREFQRDVYLMFANAMMYNRPGSDVYAMAEDVSSLRYDFMNGPTDTMIR